MLSSIESLLIAGEANAAIEFDDGSRLGCDQLLDRVELLAGFLSGRTKPGDRIVLSIGSRSEFLIGHLSIIASRCTPILFDPSGAREEIARVLAEFEPKWVLAEEPMDRTIAGLRCSPLRPRLIRLGNDEPDGFRPFYRDVDRLWLDEVESRAGDEAQLEDDRLAALLRMSPGDRLLVPAPLHHIDPLWPLIASLRVGAPLVVMRAAPTTDFWSRARELGATRLIATNATLTELLASAPSPTDRDHSVRLAVSTAALAGRRENLVRRFGFPWVEAPAGASQSSTIVE